MIKFLIKFFKKLLPKNIAGVIGVIQAAINVVREILMAASRICATLIPGDADDKIVAKIKIIFDKIVEIFEKIKNFLLKLGI